MKKNYIIGPLYWSDTYVVLGEDVVKLDVHADNDYHLASKTIIKREYLNPIIKAAAAETADELLEVIPELIDVSNWVELVIEMKNTFSGKVVSGIWESNNIFKVNGEEIKVMTTRGVSDLLKKRNIIFPCELKVIIVKYGSGKAIPWVFFQNTHP